MGIQSSWKDSFDWAHPDYVEVFRRRAAALRRIRANPQCLPALKVHYKNHPEDFISDWGCCYDPRNVEIGLPAVVPFVLFPRQVEWIYWVLESWHARRSGVNPKTRESGVSWLAVSLADTLCLHYEGMAVGFGSRKEEYVDLLESPKALFWKARKFLEFLPVEFRGGFNLAKDAPSMRLIFRETGAYITGESGDSIGRGDRTSIYFVDEAQPLTAKIMTPEGWRLMADMRPGSVVTGRGGTPVSVIHVNECGVHDVLRVTFSDGTHAECSPNHLWTVDKVWGKRKRLKLRTQEIANSYVYESPGGQVQYRYRVPVCSPVLFAEADELPLDPYVTGALLGDGSVPLKGTIRITSADQEVLDEITSKLPQGVVIGSYDGSYSYNIVDELGRQGRAKGGAYIQSRARLAVIAAGIAGFTASKKFIPDAYKFASPKDRLSILQGLMDTDGSATGGSASFYSTSLRLAEDVRFIVQSLGGTGTLRVQPNTEGKGYFPVYDVHLNLPEGMVPFRLSRKLLKLRPRSHPPGRTIVAVEHVGRQPVRCITVDAADGLYLTDSFIVTHNSAHLEHPEAADAGLASTTNCRIDISTAHGTGNPFHRKVTEWSPDKVFRFHWHDDPRKDEDWYARQVEELDPVTLAQEIDIDFSASITGVLIPSAWVVAAVDAARVLAVPRTGQKLVALDVADEGRDLCAAVGGQGVHIEVAQEWSGKGDDIYNSVVNAFGVCDEIGCRELRVDGDGLGAGARGDARVINEGRVKERGPDATIRVVMFRGSGEIVDPEGEMVKGRKNKDFFQNAKAQSWWHLRTLFMNTYRAVIKKMPFDPDQIISIDLHLPNRNKLVAELSQPTYTLNTAGKVVVDKVPDRQRQGSKIVAATSVRSPNLADGCMMRYAPMATSMVVTADAAAAFAAASRQRRRA